MWSQPLEAPPGFTARSVRPRSWSGAQLDQSGNVYQAADWRKVTSVNFIFFCAWMILEGEYFNDVPRAFCAGGVNRTYPGAARAILSSSFGFFLGSACQKRSTIRQFPKICDAFVTWHIARRTGPRATAQDKVPKIQSLIATTSIYIYTVHIDPEAMWGSSS
jgi:hypothetical protein